MNLISDYLKVSNNIRKELATELGKIDLSYTQWLTLKALKKEGKPLTSSQLVELVRSDKATMSDVLKRLEVKKFIKREKSLVDKRQSVIVLSETSSSLCEEVLILERNFTNKIFENLNEEEQQLLQELLNKILF